MGIHTYTYIIILIYIVYVYTHTYTDTHTYTQVVLIAQRHVIAKVMAEKGLYLPQGDISGN